jgi:hypothetical protein
MDDPTVFIPRPSHAQNDPPSNLIDPYNHSITSREFNM